VDEFNIDTLNEVSFFLVALSIISMLK